MDRFSNQLAGGVVYRDFTFDYGPLLYFPSWWIAAALHIPVGHAYYIFWSLEWIAGTLLLWHVVTSLQGRTSDRLITFSAVFVAWLTSITDQGAQYTPLRFIVASALALWVHRLWRARSNDETWRAYGPSMLLAALSYALLLVYSPEQGLEFCIATVLFFAIGVRKRAVLAPLLAFVGFSLVVFALDKRLGLLQSLFTFAGGAYNLPVLPGPREIFLVCMLLGVACLAVHAFLNKQSSRPEIYLIALALAAIPAGFGRADPGHIFINAMPALITMTLAAMQTRWVRLPVVAGWGIYIAGAWFGHMRPAVNVLMHSFPRMEKMPSAADLPPAGVTLRAPIRYFSYVDGQFGPKVTTGRFYGFDLGYPGLAQLKIEELEQHPRDLLVVPYNYYESCRTDQVDSVRQNLKDTFHTPFVPHLKGVPNVKLALCDYIHTHYVGSPFRVPREEYRVMQPLAFPQSPSTGSTATTAPEGTALSNATSAVPLRLP